TPLLAGVQVADQGASRAAAGMRRTRTGPASRGRLLLLLLSPLALLAFLVLPFADGAGALVEPVAGARAVGLSLDLAPLALPPGRVAPHRRAEDRRGQGDPAQVDALGRDAPALAVLVRDRPVRGPARGIRFRGERVVEHAETAGE